MRFRIPLHLKETVTVMRESAYKRGKVMTVAENVKCQIAPGKDLVHLKSGVPVQASDRTVLLEAPNAEITEGDFLVRSDGSELKIAGVRRLGNVQILDVNQRVLA